MGADPVACAALAGGFAGKAFFVRKDAKAHGLERRIEGPLLEPGDRCVVVEDVVSTGGSTLAAIAALREGGHEICGVISVLDRLMGGGEAIEAAARRAVRGAHHDRRRLSRAASRLFRGRMRPRADGCMHRAPRARCMHRPHPASATAPARSRTWICRLGGGRLVHWTTRARSAARLAHSSVVERLARELVAGARRRGAPRAARPA